MKTKLQIIVVISTKKSKTSPTKNQIQHIIDFNRMILEDETTKSYKTEVLTIKVIK